MVVTSRSSKNRIVLATITVLYLVIVAEGVSQWVHIYQAISAHEHSKTEGLLEKIKLISINPLFSVITQSLSLVVADGLLVRGC